VILYIVTYVLYWCSYIVFIFRDMKVKLLKTGYRTHLYSVVKCIRFAGDEPWPADCTLRFVAGEQFGPHCSVSVKALRPGEMSDVSVEMVSPAEPGIHQGQWKMCTVNGLYFGGKCLPVLFYLKTSRRRLKAVYSYLYFSIHFQYLYSEALYLYLTISTCTRTWTLSTHTRAVDSRLVTQTRVMTRHFLTRDSALMTRDLTL